MGSSPSHCSPAERGLHLRLFALPEFQKGKGTSQISCPLTARKEGITHTTNTKKKRKTRRKHPFLHALLASHTLSTDHMRPPSSSLSHPSTPLQQRHRMTRRTARVSKALSSLTSSSKHLFLLAQALLLKSQADQNAQQHGAFLTPARA